MRLGTRVGLAAFVNLSADASLHAANPRLFLPALQRLLNVRLGTRVGLATFVNLSADALLHAANVIGMQDYMPVERPTFAPLGLNPFAFHSNPK